MPLTASKFPLFLSKGKMLLEKKLEVGFFHDVTFIFVTIAIIGMKVIENGWMDGCHQPYSTL